MKTTVVAALMLLDLEIIVTLVGLSPLMTCWTHMVNGKMNDFLPHREEALAKIKPRWTHMVNGRMNDFLPHREVALAKIKPRKSCRFLLLNQRWSFCTLWATQRSQVSYWLRFVDGYVTIVRILSLRTTVNCARRDRTNLCSRRWLYLDGHCLLPSS